MGQTWYNCDMTKRVLIVEDRDATARRLAKTIESDDSLSVVGVVHTVASALECLAREKPDVALVDLGLPDGSGIDVIAACAASEWECLGVVISIFGDEERVIEAIRNGARGYLQKGARAPEILRSVKAVLAGGSPISPQIARYLLDELTRMPTERPKPERDVLTQRELEILNDLAQGYRRREVAERLQISVGTVGNHVNNIYKKLGVNSNLGAVAKAGKMGLL